MQAQLAKYMLASHFSFFLTVSFHIHFTLAPQLSQKINPNKAIMS